MLQVYHLIQPQPPIFHGRRVESELHHDLPLLMSNIHHREGKTLIEFEISRLFRCSKILIVTVRTINMKSLHNHTPTLTSGDASENKIDVGCEERLEQLRITEWVN